MIYYTIKSPLFCLGKNVFLKNVLKKDYNIDFFVVIVNHQVDKKYIYLFL